jgi:DNA repair protein RadC
MIKLSCRRNTSEVVVKPTISTIPVPDHIIVAHDSYYSFADEGIL